MEFSERIQIIKVELRNKGWKYADLADNSGIPLSTILKVLSGNTRSPRVDTVEAIERALGLNEKSPNSINNTFSDEEQTIIKMYRSLPEKLKQLVYDQLVIYCEHKP